MEKDPNENPKTIKTIINEDVLELFKDINPIQISLKDPNDIVLLFHATLERMMGDPDFANGFLRLAVESAKQDGIDEAVNIAREEISNSSLKQFAPSYFWPLLKVLLEHSMDPDRRKRFYEYLNNKKQKGTQ